MRKKKTEKSSGQRNTLTSNQEFLLQPVGITNLGRNFFFDQIHNTPQIAFRKRYNVFPYAWSNSTGVSSQDQGAARDQTTNVTAKLYAVTPVSEAFIEEYWPILNALLQSGLGTRYTTTCPEVIRYYATVIDTLEALTFVFAINYMVTTFDWRDVSPHSDTIPPVLWDLATLFDATDVGIQETWMPLMSRLATKVLPPNFVASIMNNSMPYLSNPYGHVVNINAPTEAINAITSWDKVDLYTQIWDNLSYLDANLSTTHNVLASFLPYRVGPVIMAFNGYNSLYEEVCYNSSVTNNTVFGDTNDPDNTTTLIVGTGAANGNSLTLYHRGLALSAQSVAENSIWDLIYNVTDDTYRILTMYKQSTLTLIDDALDIIEYDGSACSSDEKKRYLLYCRNRFQDEDGTPLAQGRGACGDRKSVV